MDRFRILTWISGRGGVATYSVLALGLLLFFALRSNGEARRNARAEVSPAERELTAQLQALRAAWDPRTRQRILVEAPARRGRYAAPLRRILRRPDYDLLGEAAEFAGALGDPTLRSVVASVALGKNSLAPKARVRAVQAAHALAPWSRTQLAKFLLEGSTPVKLAALRLCVGHPEAPWPEILAVLRIGSRSGNRMVVDGEEWAELRAAAVAAIPRQASKELRQALWDMVLTGDAEPATTALRAMARMVPGPARLQLERHLPLLSGEPLRAALQTLGAWRERLHDAERVFELVERVDLDEVTRATAMHCLECTDSFRAEKLRLAMPTMPPLVRFFAGRCLLRQHDTEGFRCLLDLIEADSGQASAVSRQLLAWMTGQRPGASRDAFERHMVTALASLRGRPLPDPKFEIGAADLMDPADLGGV